MIQKDTTMIPTERGQLVTKLLMFLLIFIPAMLYARLPKPDHVVIIILENKSYDQIIGSDAAPYINQLANDSLAALFSNYYALTHPSQPNYLWIFSGDNQGVTDDAVPVDTPFTTPNLGMELLRKGYTFCGYSEDLPYTGYDGATSGLYARKHNPWVNWQDASSNRVPAALNKPFTAFPADYDSLPVLSFVIPNEDNDMHNGTNPDRIIRGDRWIKDHLDGYIQWAKRNNSLFILTFDEDRGTSVNRIVTLFVGAMVKHGVYTERVDHINLLRTLEEMYGLGYAGKSADSTAISNCWVVPSASGSKTANEPQSFRLDQSYPNPSNPETTIRFSLPYESRVHLDLYNALGQKAGSLLDEKMAPGFHDFHLNTAAYSSGVYFYRLRAGHFQSIKKMIVMK